MHVTAHTTALLVDNHYTAVTKVTPILYAEEHIHAVDTVLHRYYAARLTAPDLHIILDPTAVSVVLL